MSLRSLSIDQQSGFVDRVVDDHYEIFPSSLVVVRICGTNVVSNFTSSDVCVSLLMLLVPIFVDFALSVLDLRALLRFLILI